MCQVFHLENIYMVYSKHIPYIIVFIYYIKIFLTNTRLLLDRIIRILIHHDSFFSSFVTYTGRQKDYNQNELKLNYNIL